MSASRAFADLRRRFAGALIRPEDPAYGQFATFLSDEGQEGVRRAYGDRRGRLVALKDRWDRDNVFHLTTNIRPTGGTS